MTEYTANLQLAQSIERPTGWTRPAPQQVRVQSPRRTLGPLVFVFAFFGVPLALILLTH